MPILIGLDYGKRRIGIAVTDPTGRLALAAGTHVEGRDGSIMDLLRELIREHEAAGLVVGLPLTADGRETRMAAQARRFARRLEEELSLPVSLFDERHTSHEAAGWIGLRGRPARRGEVDAVAAQIILQTYIDRMQSLQQAPNPSQECPTSISREWPAQPHKGTR